MRGTRGPRGLVDRAGKIEGENYTGDASGVVVPWGGGAAGVSTPTAGQPPTIPLSVDENDDGSAVMDRVDQTPRRSRKSTRKTSKAMLRWPLKILANFVAWIMLRLGVTAFGDGSDGDATLDGAATVPWASKSGSVYTLTQDVNLHNLTINNGVTLKYASFRPYGTGRLRIIGTGVLSASGNAAVASVGGAAISAQTVGGAPAGPNGNTTAGADGGADGSASGSSLGGAGGGSSGSIGGSVTAPTAVKGRSNTSFGPLMGLLIGGNAGTPAITLVNGGGSGAGGAGNSTDAGGGGGGGGGLGMASFREIVLDTTTNMMAAGGAGGTSAGNGRGGGGGGGGYMRVVCMVLDILDGTTMSAATNCPGGAAGAGHGTLVANPGVAGSTGRLELVNLVSLLG